MPAGQTGSPMEVKLAQGRAAIAKRDFARADALFKEAMGLDRKSPLPLLSLAESARVRNEPAVAKQRLGEALALTPRHPPTLRAWALWHFAHAEYPKAVEFWQAALAADPSYAAVLVDLGDYHFNINDKPEIAGEFYLRALAIDPKLAGAQYAMGMVMLRSGKLDDAFKRFGESARLSPGNALPLAAMAQVHVLQKDNTRALTMYEQALGAQPDYYAARLSKADILLAGGKTQLALAEYGKVAKGFPKVAAAHLGAGMAAQQLGQNEAALRSYQAAIALQPDNVLALNNAAWIAAEGAGVADGGLAWARKAAALAPQEPRVQGTLAWVLHKRGETGPAIQSLELLMKGAGREFAEPHYLLGRMLADKGDTARAMAELREALRINPNFGQAADAAARLRKLEKS